MISNETDMSFKITWNASTDNTAVTEYDVFLDGSLTTTTANTTYTPNGLTASTTYSVTVLAKDAVGNESAQSAPVNATTTSGAGVANELFFSEYVEGSSNNKALEIANETDNDIDLSIYDIRRNGNGGSTWSDPFVLTGTVTSGDVVVIINANAALPELINEADIVVPNASPTFGEPLNFNGNDPVGLFKNDILIDIIGVFGSSANFAEDVTLRRKSTVSSPNTTYDEVNEWDSYPQNTVDDIGSHTTTLSTGDFTWEGLSIYPNPTSLDYIYIKNNEQVKVEVFNVLGKRVLQNTIETSNPKLDISSLSSGMYLLRISNQDQSTTRKMIKN